MRFVNARRTLASLLFAAAAVAPGCSSDTEPMPPAGAGTESTADKIKDKAGEIGAKVENAAGQAVEGAGKAAMQGAVKLETSAAESVSKNVGEGAGKAVEATGNAIGKAGEAAADAGKKLQEKAETPK